MMKRNLLWGLLLLLHSALMAQPTAQVQVSGQVTFATPAQPVPFYPVEISFPGQDSNGITPILTETDENGQYQASFLTYPGIDFVVSVYNFCTGQPSSQTFENVNAPPGTVANFFNVDFQICEDILPPPPPGECQAFFIAQPSEEDSLKVEFFDLSFSENPVIAWQWNFGDGATANVQNPVHTYNEAGTYEVTLLIIADSCTSVAFYEIVVGAGNCTCSLEYAPVCATSPQGDTLSFTNICFALCAGFQPDDLFDCDGDDPCICPDIYDPVCVAGPNGVVVSFNNDCEAFCAGFDASDFISCGGVDSIFCLPAFLADISPEDSLTVEFTDYSFSNLPITGYLWNFGDGNTSTTQNPQHTYAEAGEYEVSLTITTDSCTATHVAIIAVGGTSCDCPAIVAPVCVIGADSTILTFPNFCFALCEGYTFDQIFQCDPTNPCVCPPVFDPVCVVDSSGFTFEFPNLCIAECSGFGPEDVVSCFDDSLGCYANFYLDILSDSLLVVQFTDNSWSASGDITSWNWHFGDPQGSQSNAQNPVFQYDGPGVYEISLTITTSDSCTSTVSQHICIGDGGVMDSLTCQAFFFFTQNDSLSSVFHFTDMSYGNINSWLWTFGDGTSSTEQNPVHAFAQDGPHLVTLTVSGDSCASTITMLLFSGDDYWYDDGLHALFLPIINGQEVLFLNLSSPQASSFAWDFGDGNTSSDFFPAHTYSEAGVYTVSLTAYGDGGTPNVFTATINLSTAEFTGRPAVNLLSASEDLNPTVPGFKAWPNPVADELVVEFEVRNASGNCQIGLWSMDGKPLKAIRENARQGLNQIKMETGDLAPGMYLLRLQTPEGIQTHKVIRR